MIRVAGMALLLGAAACHAAERDDYNLLSAAEEFALAAEALEGGALPEAIERLRANAAAGHLPSVEVLALALLHGPTLVGPQTTANVCEAARWLKGALRNGSEIGKRYFPLLVRLQRHGAITPCSDDGE